MYWGWKAVLTAMTVAAVLLAARQLGRHVAGLLAGLPVVSAPALMWLVSEQGEVVAARSAFGGLAACAAASAFAMAFALAARRHGVVGSLAWALLALGVCLTLLQPLRDHPVTLLLLALGAALLVWHGLRHEPRSGGAARALRGEPWLSASVSGVAGAGSAYLATLADPFWAGVAAALPVISGFALVHLLRTGGPGDVARFVAGYVPGVAASAAFLFTFALLAPRLGAGLALALAAACGALMARLGTLPRAVPAPAAAGGGPGVITLDGPR